METIMASPDWIGHPVESPYWSVDGRSIYYQVQRDGSPVRDLYRVDPATGKGDKLDPVAVAQADGPAVFDRRHAHAAFIRHGDVFVVNLADGRRTQVTRTVDDESAPQFSADGRALQYRQGNNWYTYDLASGVSAPAAVLKFADDPQAEKPDTLRDHQRALFSTLRQLKADKDAVRAQRKVLAAADPGRAPEPFWLGDTINPVDTELSPDGRWMLLVTEPKDAKPGEAPQVIHYVTDSGYTEAKDARTYVGRKDPTPQSLLLLDLSTHTSYPLDTAVLPGIKDDPLKALRTSSPARTTARAAASRGATTAPASPSSCAPSTTRIAGSPASISPGTRW
jgi:hypothetical protein